MNWQGVCIHHSKTRDTETSSWEAIRRYHIEHNGWNEIGYHYGIENVTGCLRLRIGRPLNMQGAHAPQFNRTHIGLLLVGDFDIDLPARNLIDYAAMAVADIFRFYKIELNEKSLCYHRDAADKTCPGDLFPPKDFMLRAVSKYLEQQ